MKSARSLSLAERVYRTVGKRLLDICLSALGLVAVSLPLALLVWLIRHESHGSALLPQERVTCHGRRFTMWKLRTMYSNAEADGRPRFAAHNDSRVTRLGRWLRATRLDELPQLWNVLRGDMSLVGPRPERPLFVAAFEREIPRYGRRHRLRPGLTGWAQIHIGYADGLDTTRAKTAYDLEYIDRVALLFDLAILLRTTGFLWRQLRSQRRRRPASQHAYRTSE